ncbi:hypothetical protein VIGAN_06143800, partial [Vigna angularis var. angularis]
QHVASASSNPATTPPSSPELRRSGVFPACHQTGHRAKTAIAPPPSLSLVFFASSPPEGADHREPRPMPPGQDHCWSRGREKYYRLSSPCLYRVCRRELWPETPPVASAVRPSRNCITGMRNRLRMP